MLEAEGRWELNKESAAITRRATIGWRVMRLRVKCRADYLQSSECNESAYAWAFTRCVTTLAFGLPLSSNTIVGA